MARGLAASFLLSVALASFPSVDEAQDRDVFREAYPQCFRLFAEGSAERAACLVALPWRRAFDYDDEALTALVQKETAPTPAGGEFRDLFPRCFTQFPDGSWDRRICLDVSARHGYARYTDAELRAAVAAQKLRYETALRDAERRRLRLEDNP
jgi:hypothetical protein